MKEGNGKETNAADLHLRAEKLLAEARTSKGPHPKNDDTSKLIHELQVHQIELEMQNEELMQVRSEIEVSLEKYSDLYDFAPVGYFTLTDKGIIREVNLTGTALLGEGRSRLIDRRFGLFISNETQPAFFAFLKKVCEGNTKEKCEVVLTRSKDNPRYIHLEGRAWEADNSMDRLCLMAVMDITNQKQTAEALKSSEMRYRRLFETAQDGIVILDAETGQISDVNPFLVEMLGYSHEDFLGKKLWEIGAFTRAP